MSAAIETDLAGKAQSIANVVANVMSDATPFTSMLDMARITGGYGDLIDREVRHVHRQSLRAVLDEVYAGIRVKQIGHSREFRVS